MPPKSYFRSMIRFAPLLLVVLMTRGIALAQGTEVWIIVNGPWTYVEDPDDSTRVVITAPNPDHHLPPALTPQPDGISPSLPMGHHTLQVVNRAAVCSATAPRGAEVPASLFPLSNIDKATIQGVIQNRESRYSRYSISLPKPCYYSSAETSYSIISPDPITGSPADQEKAYTTGMILHYFVTADSPATLTLRPDLGDTSTVPVPFHDNKITIEMRTDDLPENTPPCDPMSADSFRKEIGLFTQTQTFHLWFPETNEVGGQKKGHYADNCQDPELIAAKLSPKDKAAAPKVLAEIKAVEEYFAHPNPKDKRRAEQKLNDIQKTINGFQANQLKMKPFSTQALSEVNRELDTAKQQIQTMKPANFEFQKSTTYSAYFSVGSGDCHGAQTGIDGTIP